MSLVSATRSTQLLNCTSAIVLELPEKTIQYSHQSRLQTGELHELLRKPMNIHHVLQTCTMITGGGGIPPLPAHAQTVDTRPYLLNRPGYEARMTSIQNGGYFWLKTNYRVYLCCLEFLSGINYPSFFIGRKGFRGVH